ncbi:MAG TPA: hypothetical protein VMP42_06165 [Actinomycetota bacterium]|nr:hypothetical protein [Actinomycetota bacterium]
MAERWLRRLGDRLEGEEPPADLWERVRHREVSGTVEPAPIGDRLPAGLVAIAIVAGIALGGWVLLGPARDLARVADDVPGPALGPSPTVSTRPEIPQGGVTLACPEEEQIDFTFAGPLIREPAGAAIIRVNLAGIRGTDTLEQVSTDPNGETRWDGVWRVVRDGSVIAMVRVPELNGVACAGSGISGSSLRPEGSSNDIYFATRRSPAGSGPNAGPGTATIVERSGCLILESLYEGDAQSIGLWPQAWRLVTSGGKTVILDADGREVAAVGDTVLIGGGDISRSVMLQEAEDLPPTRCTFDGFSWVTAVHGVEP